MLSLYISGADAFDGVTESVIGSETGKMGFYHIKVPLSQVDTAETDSGGNAPEHDPDFITE